MNNSKTPQDNGMIFETHFAYIENAHCSKMLPWQPFVSNGSNNFLGMAK